MSKIVFWRLERPDYESDYDDTFINGYSKHDFGLPGIKCRLCGQTWSGTRVLPFILPERLHSIPELASPWPIYAEDHNRLKKVVLEVFREGGMEVADLEPGDEFQPAYLEIPSIPNSDFIWSGIGSVLVSERIREIFHKNDIHGVEFVPVIMRKVGNNPHVLPAPIPSTGEPEDIFDEIEYLENVDKVSKYYEMVVINRCKRPPGTEILSKCSLCKREEYDSSKRVLTMKQNMWNGDEIFILPTSLWIIVTDKIKNLLEDINSSNVKFAKL